MIKIKACIFDLDGTLVDSLKDITTAINHTLEHFNRPLCTREECKYWVGWGMKGFIESILEPHERDRETIAEFVEKYRVYYDDHIIDYAYVYEGMTEVLDILYKQDIKLAIISNKPERFTTRITELLFERDIFTCVYGSNDEMLQKPNAEIGLRVLSELGVSPGEACYIGDSDIDIEFAKNTGMTSIAVSWGFRNRDELLEYNPDYMINHPSEIVDIVLK